MTRKGFARAAEIEREELIVMAIAVVVVDTTPVSVLGVVTAVVSIDICDG